MMISPVQRSLFERNMQFLSVHNAPLVSLVKILLGLIGGENGSSVKSPGGRRGNAPLTADVKALCEMWASKASEIAEVGKIEIRVARNGSPVPYLAGTGLSCHSGVDPDRESERRGGSLANVSNRADTVVEVYGTFFLYHVPPAERVVLIDTDPGFFILSLGFIDYERHGSGTRFMFFAPSLSRLYETDTLLGAALFSAYNPLCTTDIVRVRHPLWHNAAWRTADETAAAEESLAAVVRSLMLGWKTAALSYRRTILQTWSNLGSFLGAQNNGSTGQARSYSDWVPDPTREYVLIGASPSLDDNGDEIAAKAREGNLFIVAVDNGVRFLVSRGIKPSLIVSLDNRPFLARMIPESCRDVPTIAPLSVYPRFFSRMRNLYCFGLAGVPYPRVGLKAGPSGRFFPEKLMLPALNVGLFAWLLLKEKGINPVAVYGVDFSFSERKYYYKDAYFYERLIGTTGYAETVCGRSVAMTLARGETMLFSTYRAEYERRNKLGIERSSEEMSENPDLSLLAAGFYLKGCEREEAFHRAKRLTEHINTDFFCR